MKSETEITLPLFDADRIIEIALNPVSPVETAPEGPVSFRFPSAMVEVLNSRGVPHSALHD
jgi:hypothetical protein